MSHASLVLVPSLPPIRSHFAWSAAPPTTDLSVHLFRRTFDLTVLPESLRIHVSADSRYVLWFNGEQLGRGPLKGTLQHYHVETYELAGNLRLGRNVLAAEVRWLGRSSPLGEVHSHQPGLYVQSDDITVLDTPGAWRTYADDSVTPGWDDPFQTAIEWLGPMDRIDAGRRPRGWREPDFDDSAWTQAIPVGGPLHHRAWGESPSHQLQPRDIPALSEISRPFLTAWQNQQTSKLPWAVAANVGGELWLDVGELTTAYPVLEFTGGQGREIRIVYAEALGRWEDIDGGRQWSKQRNRRDTTQGVPHGYRDVIILPDHDFVFEPFHWRTFWFIKIEILPGPAPVSLHSAHYRFTTFPQEMTARFDCSDPDIEVLWSTSLHTLRLCAHETYEDCPYYEQLNYAGDSRIQALCSHYLANSTALGRRCLRLFRDATGAKGLTTSREPSRVRQIIPAFSLHWILMLDDHWQWVGESDIAFVRESLGVVDAILCYFRERLTDQHFVGEIDHWRWIDCVQTWTLGVPPVVAAGEGSTYLTALFVTALDRAVELHQSTGNPSDADRWIALAQQLRKALQLTWSESEGLFIEGPGRKTDPLTQHSQAMVLLAGAATDAQQCRIGQRLVDDPRLVQMSLFQRFYLAQSLAYVDRFDRFFPKVLAPWREMIQHGLSTWLEHAEFSRSDCHAWSSWNTIVFLRDVLGARPALPGWKAIRIEPQFRATDAASGEFTTPTGLIRIEWKSNASGQIDLSIKAPMGVPVTVVLPGLPPQTFTQGGEIRLTVRLLAA